MTERPIIALDFASKKEVTSFLATFPKEELLFLKIGMELFYQEGPEIVRELKKQGHSIFLDLKLHDIPHTVEKAMSGLARLEIDMTNVHAAGGIQMMQAAKKGLQTGTKIGKMIPKLLAVTQLTSTSEEKMQEEQLIEVSLNESVLHYAACTAKAGLAGVVCSAKEAQLIKQATSDQFICLTPGVRPSGTANGDQKRVVTPSQARSNGATFIVVGRPITQAVDPYQAYQAIKKEWSGQIDE